VRGQLTCSLIVALAAACMIQASVPHRGQITTIRSGEIYTIRPHLARLACLLRVHTFFRQFSLSGIQ
jgi:hypothetical protein